MSEPSLQVMTYHPIKEIWFYLLAAVVLATMAGYAWQYRRTPAALYWAIGLALRTVFILALVMVTVSPALTDKVFWVKIQQSSGLIIIPLFFLLVINVAEQKSRIIRAATLSLVTLSAFGILALLTTGWHGLFWRGVVWDGANFGVIRGPIYWGVMGITYLQFLAVMGLCLFWGLRASGLRRWQLLALPFDPLISITGHILWVIDQKAGIIPPLPLAFMLSGIIWSWILLRFQVFNLAQLAQTAVARNMNDSLIIIDDQDYIVELNTAARKLLGDRAQGMVGSRLAIAFASWPALAELASDSQARTGEISLEGGNYLFRIMPLNVWCKSGVGKAIVLQDISKLKQAQFQIAEQQKALSIMAERERLGRELHDGYGQLWGYVNMQVEAARTLLGKRDQAQANLLLEKLASIIRDVHVDIRESITGLQLKGAEGQDVWQKLQEYLQWFEHNYNIKTELSISDEFLAGRLPPITEVQLLRIIQESLTNIRKHAGASHVKVAVTVNGSLANIVVADNGYGFDEAVASSKKGSFGLKIMQDRAAEIGAEFQIHSKPGDGTRVVLLIPLTDDDETYQKIGPDGGKDVPA